MRESTEYYKIIRDELGEVHYVYVDKIGGGTVGEQYAQEDWDVEIYDASGEMVWASGSGLYVGSPKTHQDVAYIAMDFYING